MRHIFCDSLKRFLVVCVLTVVGIFSATAANLPSGYTELEYIESTGTQEIDTGVLPSAVDDIYVRFKNTTTDAGYLIGAAGGGKYNYVGIHNAFSGYGENWGSSSQYTGFSVHADTSNIHEIEVDLTSTPKFYLDSVLKATQSAYATISSTYTLKINANVFGSQTRCSARYYEVKLSKNGTMIRDFIPAKNASGVVGMYDTVNDQFYTNAGTGTFTAGPVACNGTRMNYTTATGTVTQNGTPTPTNPITPTFYTQGDMVLRKVGDVADSYDSTTGKITRRVGMKVLDGTEDWKENATSFYLDEDYNAVPTNHQQSSSHYEYNGNQSAADLQTKTQAFYLWGSGNRLRIRDTIVGSLTDFTDFLAAQYTAGTPVTVYYLLATETEEDWPAEQCIVSDGIKIATTKYTEDAFANLVTTLESAITKVTNIVDTTVQQATEIGNLATTKQDRPDTDCPAGRKCLLIMGADNKPHWYLIQE